MPGYSYGITATKCITGSKLRKVPGSVCSSCYAMTDWYRSWRPLLQGHARRWNGLRHPRWVDAMVAMITQKCQPPDHYFRFHDSGDLQGVWHLENICEVARRCPSVTFWLPTREYDIVREYLASERTLPPNLTVRLSAHMIDSEPVLPPELEGMPTSTVSSLPKSLTGEGVLDSKGSVQCLAVEKRDNKCGSCRSCWSRDVKSVNYAQH